MIPRRRFLGSLAGAACAPWSVAQGVSVSTAEAAVERAHEEIWRRFVDGRFNTLLHYAGPGGEVVLPTAEECARCEPNGMSWSTPIEDGPFFGGLYLDGLCERWRVRRDEQSAGKARRIAAGLMKLAELGSTPGFIARGIGADGRAHYPASSEDQMFPWVYGLWRYLRTELPSSDERGRIVAKIVATVEAVEKNAWRVPCDPAAFGERGDFTRAGVHDAARFLFLLRRMHELTADDRWVKEYRARLMERVGKAQRTRQEIIADGLLFGPPEKSDSYLWTNSMSQAALRVLMDEAESEREQLLFRRGLIAGARSAAAHLGRSRQWDNLTALGFDVDWRFLKQSWKAQANCDEAIALARSQLPLWAAHNPRSPYEDDTVREPLFAAWMIMLTGDRELRAEHGPEIEAMLSRYDWKRLYTSTFFIAVNIGYERR